MKAVVFTLGCKVNSCESQSLIRELNNLGFEVYEELCKADLYIINTCAVTNEAEKKSRQAISRVKKYNENAKIIVTGCASQKSPESFLNKSGVTVVTGTFKKDKIISLLNESGCFLSEPEKVFNEMAVPKTEKCRAFIKVQDGCNNFCSYCIIPYLRGRSRSRSVESIKNEILALNPLEAVLTAINLTDYNYNGINLAGLISSLSTLNVRIRLGSLEENVITEEFLLALKNLKNFAPHFHLSLQSGCDNTLKAMRRRYTTQEFERGVNLIRKHFDNASITTDVIVGYPTETDLDFSSSLEFIEKLEFSDLHIFCYSEREGTLSSKLKDLPSSVKKERSERLFKIKELSKSRFISKNMQIIQDVIIEEIEGDYSVGYTGNYIKVYVDKPLKCGQYKIKLTAPFRDGALGELEE